MSRSSSPRLPFIAPLLLFFLLHLPLLVPAIKFELPGPRIVYRTEPDFQPIKIAVKYYTNDTSLLQPGLIFIAPHITTRGWGPHIFDHNGNLVWYGQDLVGRYGSDSPANAMNFGVCDYLGETGKHLCWTEARLPPPSKDSLPSIAVNRIFDNTYTQAGFDFGIVDDFVDPNPHEFNVLPGGKSFVQSVFRPRKWNLKAYGGSKNGWVLDGCFQEIDLRTSEEVFRWCYLDVLPIWNTELYMNIPSNALGKGNQTFSWAGSGTKSDPWDFMHINAIDKNSEGDYLVSGRYLSQILKVAGPETRQNAQPGSVLWRLGGNQSDFEMPDNARFSMQQHSRFISSGSQETVISLFDNAYNGETQPSSLYSSAKIITLSNTTAVASLTSVYKHPNEYLAYGQGNAQILQNGNVYVGWGAYPEWSEYTRGGRLLSHGQAIANGHASRGRTHENYRAYKFHWTAHPATKPKVIAYSETCQMNFNTAKTAGSPLIVYVSWNGATEVRAWRFQISSFSINGPWLDAGRAEKHSFETKATLGTTLLNPLSFARYVKVDALAEDGSVLATSYNETFVPNAKVKDHCTANGCSHPKRFHYSSEFNRASTCELTVSNEIPAIIMLGLFLLFIEILNYYVMHRFVGSMVDLARLKGTPGKGIDDIRLGSSRSNGAPPPQSSGTKAEGKDP